MKRILLPRAECTKSISFNEHAGLKHVVMYEPSPIDEMIQEKCQPSDDKKESVSFIDPIYLLFNQQRLESLGTMGAKAFLDSLIPKSDSLDALRKQCSDDDLIAMLKSRHLQSPSEILAWCRYIQSNVDVLNEEIAKVAAQQQAAVTTDVKVAAQQQAAVTTDVEPKSE